jgi:GntR family transcriptional regulator / MocR family aminotransferase
VEWAAAHDALVIEDDYDGEYRYDREPVGALQGFGGDRVAYLGSTSKTLAPALRLGWTVLPAALAGAVADERGWSDGGSPALDQLALASFIERGELDRHLRRMRLRYRRRRDWLVAALGRHLPEAEVGGAAAGLHVTVALAPDADVDEVLARASARGVGVFAAHHAGRPLLLVGYANIAETAIEPAVRALATAVRGR